MKTAEQRTRDLVAAAEIQIREERNQKGIAVAPATQARHSPGPWHATQCPMNTGLYVQNDKLQLIANPQANHTIDQTTKDANARLIAAAPDLLEACQAVLAAEGEDWETGRRVLRAAVEKATQPAAPAGTHADPIRYEHIAADDPARKAKFRKQLDQFEKDAKAGKVLCLSDLMISAGM